MSERTASEHAARPALRSRTRRRRRPHALRTAAAPPHRLVAAPEAPADGRRRAAPSSPSPRRRRPRRLAGTPDALDCAPTSCGGPPSLTIPVWLGHLRQPAALQHPLHRPTDRRVPPDRQRLAPRHADRGRSPPTWPASCPAAVGLVILSSCAVRRRHHRARDRPPHVPAPPRERAAWSATSSSPAPTPRAATSRPCSRPSRGWATRWSASSTTTPPAREPVPGVPAARRRRRAPRHPPGVPQRQRDRGGQRRRERRHQPPGPRPARPGRPRRAVVHAARHLLAAPHRAAARPLPGRLRRAGHPRRLAGRGQAHLRRRSAPVVGLLVTAPDRCWPSPSPSSSTRRARSCSARSGWARTPSRSRC